MYGADFFKIYISTVYNTQRRNTFDNYLFLKILLFFKCLTSHLRVCDFPFMRKIFLLRVDPVLVVLFLQASINKSNSQKSIYFCKNVGKTLKYT